MQLIPVLSRFKKKNNKNHVSLGFDTEGTAYGPANRTVTVWGVRLGL